MTTFRIPTKQFRSIATPAGSASSKFGLFFTQASNISRDLLDWREVNPREINRRSSVYKAIVRTLSDEPERFHERNRGITIIADDLTYDDKRQEVILHLNDMKQHGVIDGAHTLDAIIEVQNLPQENESPSFVFIKTIIGIDADQIAEIAGGLNTSQAVDLKSLENLRHHFNTLQEVLAEQPYANSIAYKMNEDKPIDVREILYYLAVFDCGMNGYNEKKHPVALFGRKEGIVRKFSEQAGNPKEDDSFPILISKAPEILRLRDLIEKCALDRNVGRYKVGTNTRIRSKTNLKNRLMFLDEKVNGKIPLGWIMPMLAGFRANVLWNEPRKSFSWIVPIDELVDTCIDRLVPGIQEVHEQENSRPEYVGRNAIAWRICYGAVSNAILEWRLKEAQKK